jgi:PGF-pre-PGF domain-containing protein
VSFDSKKTAGKITTTVEILKNKSALTSSTPTGEVYKYLNIWVGSSGFGTSKNIENSFMCFKVEKSWIQDKNIDQSSITLNMYNDKKWDQLSTNLSGEDEKYLYFTAKTHGFSYFAITGKKKATGTETQLSTGNKTESAVNDTQNNAINKTKTNQTHEKTQGSDGFGKEGTKTPDFEIATGIVCLMSVFLYKRR